ncbi:DUF1801 domain-containing protein [Roseibium sp. MMSF_3544]|uniref:DUF1801 domain-containing protein n=1 Tax=unclassified Roseibium TaxID=2629323 RepID=UPI00273EB8F8|nr:DUF1801 domain-containing protein [Roseibium sp. MMSF_3544]
MNKARQTLDLIGSYPEPVRGGLRRLREIILETAASTEDAGTLEETLKWGQPSFVSVKPRTGTTIRIDRDKTDAGDVALFVNCQTSLVSDWRTLFPHLRFGGDRSVHFSLGEDLPENEIRHMVAMALTYHTRKSARKAR